MGKKKIIITPETHWDREWYLPFQEYRAKLTMLMDSLLKIYESDPNYSNFTLDGQTVPIEDYLEVKPEKEPLIEKYIKEGRLSVGPFYILPDTYLISGEAMIRNLMMGHNIANKYGRVMKAGYIPDPFGHFAQMPQILAGFGINSILFARGFGDEFEKLGLNMEFIWEAPSNAGRIIGIHLIKGYGSVARLDPTLDPKTKLYKNSLDRIKNVVKDLSKYTKTDAIILNNGSDHLFPQPHISHVVKQWNELFGDSIGIMEQADFEKYINLVLEDPNINQLKTYQGELHGGRYNYLLSGVLSTRMWIKKLNKLCESRLERYTEPFATMAWLLNKDFEYPRNYIWTAWRWLLRNHPHDSICGCSVDEVHDFDMQTRFRWSEQIALEIFKNSGIALSEVIDFDTNDGEQFPIFVFNPSPWKRSSLVSLPIISDEKMYNIIGPDQIKITDAEGNELIAVDEEIAIQDRYLQIGEFSYSLNFIAEDIPPLGIKTYYIIPGEESELDKNDLKDKVKDGEENGRTYIENKFYKIFINKDGTFDVFDKDLKKWFYNQGYLEDVGDWGDEYDFSGPKKGQVDTKIITKSNSEFIKGVDVTNYGISATFSIYYELELPESLSEDRKCRSQITELNFINVYVSLNAVEKIIYIDVDIDNASKDHRLRIMFPSGMKSVDDCIDADGHFYVIHRSAKIPDQKETKHWAQPPVPTHHQNHFVSVFDGNNSFSVLNFGLPEYEAIIEDDKTITFAITLLRCVGWLSRHDLETRSSNAGPPLSTIGAQCLDTYSFSLGLASGKGNWLDAKTHKIADEFIHPFEVINPISLQSSMRMLNAFNFRQMNVVKAPKTSKEVSSEFSLCKLDNDALLMTAFKRSDKNNNSFIVRVVNMSNEMQNGKITLFIPAKSVEIVNLNEEKQKNDAINDIAQTVATVLRSNLDEGVKLSKLDNNSFEFDIKPNIIATFKIKI
ncbi:MAG: alpha-mannosidase [Promethearchaeota archaeon]